VSVRVCVSWMFRPTNRKRSKDVVDRELGRFSTNRKTNYGGGELRKEASFKRIKRVGILLRSTI